MPQRPVEAGGTLATDAASPRHDEDVPPDAETRVVIKADLLPAARVLGLVTLTGLPLGWVWSQLAPPQLSRIAAGGTAQAVLNEDYHVFDDLAISFLVGFAAGLLVGAALWVLRRRRGPVMLLAGVLGSLAAGALAFAFGPWFAALAYPMPSAPHPGMLVAVAPTVSTPWVVLAQPLGVAISYGLAASWNGLDGLGR